MLFTPAMKTPKKTTAAGDDSARIAKVIARAGICSRREAESMITEGRVALNGRVLDTPAVVVKPGDVVTVDGQPLPERERTRLWMFHKPRGVVTTTHDPEGRPTVFDVLPPELPRVMTVGRLDINTEGLLLLTNDGGLSRILELPATGWLRRYRVRAHGEVSQEQLDKLRDGIAIEGILYGAVEATLDSRKGENCWLTVGLREGKNREVKNILAHLGLEVNRLIRLSFGPFQLGDLAEGSVEEVPRRVLKEQLGERLAIEAGADFRLREGDRDPVQKRPDALPPEPKRRAREDAEAPEEKGRVARPTRRPDATASRRRHEADVEHNAEARAAPNRSRGRLGASAVAAPGDRTAAPSRRARPEPTDAPRAHRSGKAFEVDRKGRAAPAEEPKPGRKGGRPQPVSLDDPNARISRPPKTGKTGSARKPEPMDAPRGGKRRAPRPDESTAGYRPPLDARAPRPEDLPRRDRAERSAGRSSRPRDEMPTGIVFRPKSEMGRDRDRDQRGGQERPDRAGAPAKGGLRSRGMLGPKSEGAPSKARGTRTHAPSGAGGPARPRPADVDPAGHGGRRGGEREGLTDGRPAKAGGRGASGAGRAERPAREDRGPSPKGPGARGGAPRGGGQGAGDRPGRGPKGGGPGKPRGPNADRRR